MKAIILAAGIASRLRPLTNDRPKCLLNVGDKNLLGRSLDALLSNNLNEVIIVTGYLHNMIEDYVKADYPQLKVEYIYNELYASTNNIYSLWMTKEAVASNDVLLLDSDILFDPQIITTLLKSSHPNCLALNVHELGEEEIKIIADKENKILEISKTCSIEDAIGESIGIEKMSSAFMSKLFAEMDIMITERNQSNVFYELAFENIIQQGVEMYAVDTTSMFSMELDTVEDFENACSKIPSHLL